ncbi:hypothetical protein EVAR_51910_1 [Eumeta japonica]|uniref:Uncharacterized protein n=1 Tax=Eumeta variegata TaxID=151549 RepID=A0A4C1XJI4_EUMVA|nr:hypothetical protein EVAR_51910_1 [Eumeta japonica]
MEYNNKFVKELDQFYQLPNVSHSFVRTYRGDEVGVESTGERVLKNCLALPWSKLGQVLVSGAIDLCHTENCTAQSGEFTKSRVTWSSPHRRPRSLATPTGPAPDQLGGREL